MDYLNHFHLLADYNGRLNQQIYQACQSLSNNELNRDRGAFFSSILATLNHILVGDLIWLNRFSTHSKNYTALADLADIGRPQSLDQVLFTELTTYWQARSSLDNKISTWVKQQLSEQDLTRGLSYCNMAGQRSCQNFAELVSHFFNHQTHHRGQVSTLLSQQGIDIGVTDFLFDIPKL
ncbi:DinB family protein [Catenovulum sp. SM1970]|uniref:DinB family protein n=1 Tax=Marinifaba aquimaris TaxID=2741323 RepID=UPI001572900A|nr:DinB family protein [Marinifaba aquimaris]NTS76277.1 DinB family protein [Marinifaba aquimaris]